MIFDKDYRLSDKYELTAGRAFMTGIQALVRLPLMQKQLDVRNGLNTAGFISGYRGSPLGAYDMELWRNKKSLAEHDVHFEPGINEDLGATAVWGTQLIDYYRDDAERDGVFSYWYGKAHGVDRSADVFRQANIQGTAKLGGVLAFCGDDHAAESSMFSHQTDQIFEAAMMPILFPATVEEYLSMGLAGIALSRYCGLWVGFKTITETVESGASVTIPEMPNFVVPEDFKIPAHGLNYDVNLKWPAERMEYERRMIEERAMAAHAFVYANKIDKVLINAPTKRLGIVTVGKAHGDLMEALQILGLTEEKLKAAGISLYKVGMSWPLEPRGIREFAEGMESLLVVEEKRPQLEKQIKEQLYNWPHEKRPEILGKRDRNNDVLLPEIWVFTPEIVASAVTRWLTHVHLQTLVDRKTPILTPCANQSTKLVTRTPYFCSGCPHNTSTKIPAGSIAGAGIGCHIMVLGQGRRSETFTHMGGEGVHWVGLHRFSKRDHMFQNLGDGTYQHSGSLAIRQAVTSNVNITYKLLYNDAVAMVGGQPVDGQPSPGQIAQQMLAEGVKRVVIVSDGIDKYRNDVSVPNGVMLHDRDDLEAVQRELRTVRGVTAIIYEQTCAAEKRRRRKKGKLDDPAQRLYINDRVCEGCGDCSEASNCISIEPKETVFGRKRQINQSSCNKDYSCAKGFCPSFVSVIGGEIRKPELASVKEMEEKIFAALPDIDLPELDQVYSVLIAGIGGSGVLTIGALLSMAAHLEGKGTTTLDFTGLSQKNGAVAAHVKIAPRPGDIHLPRIVDGGANLVLACDMVAAARYVAKMRTGVTRSVVNTTMVPVAAFTRNNDLYFPIVETKNEFVAATSKEEVDFIDATSIAESLFGDSIATNLFMVGFAYQKGLLPLHEGSIERAIELNGVAIEVNRRAFRWGRLAAHDLSQVQAIVNERNTGNSKDRTVPKNIDQQIEFHRDELVRYQDARYADRYVQAVTETRQLELEKLGTDTTLTPLAVKYLYKLMAYKDEYEIARLYSEEAFRQKLGSQFEGRYEIKFHLAPPLLSRKDKVTGLPRKMTFGSWMLPVFKVLSKFKRLRGTGIDPFGYTHERRTERQLIDDYQKLLTTVMGAVTENNLKTAIDLLSLPEQIRGYGYVKERNLNGVRSRWDSLYAEFAAIELKKTCEPAAPSALPILQS